MRQKPKKRLGQNFLIDKNIQDKIIRAADLRKDDIVLEIGPGRGEITGHLLTRVKKVVAVEIDGRLCDGLKNVFSSFSNFILINSDILKVNLQDFFPERKIKVVANLPYNISTPVISRLIEERGLIDTIFLTLQKELAMRLTAGPGGKDYGAFSCFVQFYTRPQILFSIKNNSFWPKPKVDSCFVELRILPKPRIKVKDEELLFKVIRLAFNQRRKAIKNSLDRMADKAVLEQCFKNSGIDPQHSRAEDLSLADFACLANAFS